MAEATNSVTPRTTTVRVSKPRATARVGKSAARPFARGLQQAGEMAMLFCQLVIGVVRKPYGFWTETRYQAYETLKLCWIPMAVSTTAFGFAAPGLQGGNIYLLFGIPERLGSFFLMASVREFAPWINAMVVAGVMGTAMTADLGARRIREEFDAMEILGVDPVREIILPRVIALTIMTGFLDIAALVCGVIGGWLAALELGATTATYFGNFWANATTTDIAGSVLKTTIFGLLIGLVCCYKGYRAKGGPIGVGRAVNQAVVIAFAAIYIFNFMFTQLMLGLNPDMLVFR
ncbi:MAG TPA: ABC transporter permease [Pseudonocardia sp.]|jgi:phospholipid/cholesterol/gamma-HCH transport system permease protein|nr:ABC transporter permease [Pseudonocardia sp.]